MITVHYDGKPIYDICIENDYSALAEKLAGIGDIQNSKVCIVSETNVAPLYLDEVKAIAGTCFACVTSFVFPAGEEHKNLDVVKDLYEHLIVNRFERGDYLIALGGGVTGDLTGYAAATYLRGISFIQLPTTLLSQVDSSIGGKTGVDFGAYKNMVGAFHMPSLVYISLKTLFSLSDRQYLEGMGEIIKHGLIKDAGYYGYLDQNMDKILARDLDTMREMIRVSCNIKRMVVEKDPKEKGERALLNFGHTLGHAVEKVSDFSLLHGECVSLGIAAASYISNQRGLITKEDYDHILSVLEAAKLPVTVENIDSAKAIEAVKHDKKMEAGKVKFVLLESCGKAFVDRSVSFEEMEEGLESIFGGHDCE